MYYSDEDEEKYDYSEDDEIKFVNEVNVGERIQFEKETIFDGVNNNLKRIHSSLINKTAKDRASIALNAVISFFTADFNFNIQDINNLIESMYEYPKWEKLNPICLVAAYQLHKTRNLKEIMDSIPENNNIRQEDVVRYYRLLTRLLDRL